MRRVNGRKCEEMSEKRKLGDRKDGKLLRKQDPMHFIMPLIYPNRCDNEAYISECIDLTNLDAYLENKCPSDPDYKYNLFQAIVTALLKTIMLRPKMNRFIANGNTYQRNDITASFIIKKEFADNGAEGFAILKAHPDDNIDTVHNYIKKRVKDVRTDVVKDDTEDAMKLFNVLPRFISKTAVRFICWLDKHGWVPQSMISSDPYYASAILTNLGSIKLHAGYHHLTNWGTTSVFVIVGERKLRPFYDDEGNVTMRDSVDIGLTVDERIGDGYYFSKTVRLLKKLLEQPELLEKPMSEEIEY